MSRRVLTDVVWKQLQIVMRAKGCHLYKLRDLVENLFAKLKHHRSIATRFEKLARNFRATPYLACTMIWLRTN